MPCIGGDITFIGGDITWAMSVNSSYVASGTTGGITTGNMTGTTS